MVCIEVQIGFQLDSVQIQNRTIKIAASFEFKAGLAVIDLCPRFLKNSLGREFKYFEFIQGHIKPLRNFEISLNNFLNKKKLLGCAYNPRNCWFYTGGPLIYIGSGLL